MGYKFNRQKPLGRYIVDFYCKPLNLVIEVDEDYHHRATQKLKDNERQQILQSMNLNFLRFPDKDIFDGIDLALEIIRNFILVHEEMDPGMRKPVRRK